MDDALAGSLFFEALAAFGAGRIVEAAERCRRLLDSAPQHVEGLRLLAILELQSGRPRDAEQLLRRAIALAPSHARLHNDLGAALAQTGQTELAAGAFRTAWQLDPDDPDIACNFGVSLLNARAFSDAVQVFETAARHRPNDAQLFAFLGDALREAGCFAESVDAYTRAASLAPNDAQIHFRLGYSLRAAGRAVESLAAYRRAAAISPTLVEAHFNAGNILKEEKRLPEAAEAYARALSIRPDYLDALQNLAMVFEEGGRLDDAETAYRHVLRLHPTSLQAHLGLGNVLALKGNLPEAIAIHRQALLLHPDNLIALTALAASLQTAGSDSEAIALFDRILQKQPGDAMILAKQGRSLWRLGRLDEAVQSTRGALKIRPDFPDARYELSQQLLSMGKYQEGWDTFECRFDLYAPPAWKAFRQPIWRGEDLRGRTLLLHGEQGSGDQIQFARYIPLLVERGARIFLRCHTRLSRLLSDGLGLERVITEQDALPDFDFHLPLLSIPRLLGTNETNIPAKVPYLKAPDAVVAQWRDRFPSSSKLKVGITWAGSVTNRILRHRSMSLADLAPILNLPEIQFFSLQVGPQQAQLAGNGFPITDLSADLKDFADTAAAMMHMDLVLTIDTSVAHLAGALARPTWVMLSHDSNWRWLRDRSDSPWYPTMTLFRQPQTGDWNSMVSQVAEKLIEVRDELAQERKP